MNHRKGWSLSVLGLMALASATLADQFEQLDGPLLVRTIKGPEVRPRTGLSFNEIGGMPGLLKDTRSALVLARTGQGNPVRLLIVPELRKPFGDQGPRDPIPVIVIERLDTFDAGDPTSRLASRKEIVLFDGFPLDLDTGQIVPEGQGGDLIFRSQGESGSRIETLGEAKLYTLTKAPAIDTSKAPQPTPGKQVLPSDFAGRYRMFANGQWSGTLDLKVEGRGVVIGQYRSDLHGTTYAVSGQVATDVPHKILFAIKYPRARQEFEGYLWAEGKGAMAGVASINERPVGFFAIREDSRFAPEEAEIGPLALIGKDRPGEHLVEILDDRVTMDRKPATLEEVVATLKLEVDDESKPVLTVLIRASSHQTYRDVMRVVEALQAAGVRHLRFETSDPVR